MRKRSLVAVAGISVSVLALAACSSSSSGGTAASSAAAKPKVGVILPDSASSARWETNDRPLLKAAFDAAGVDSDIQNAGGDVTKFATIADQMINEKVNVLLIVNLDSASGAAVETKAKAAGIPTIDYDRLTLGGSASYYVSFDNVAVGKAIGDGLVKCMGDQGHKTGAVIELDGSPTDNNATLFKQGYDGSIKAAGYTVAADQAVPGWDNVKGGQIFEQMLAKAGGKVDGVLAANDGLGGAAIAVLKKNKLQVPVTGQDATVDGLRNILTGDQCMTVYKAIKVEADAAAKAAIALASGTAAPTTGTVKDTQLNKDVPSVLATPVAIYKANVKDVVADGFVTKADVCKDLDKECAAAGIA